MLTIKADPGFSGGRGGGIWVGTNVHLHILLLFDKSFCTSKVWQKFLFHICQHLFCSCLLQNVIEMPVQKFTWQFSFYTLPLCCEYPPACYTSYKLNKFPPSGLHYSTDVCCCSNIFSWETIYIYTLPSPCKECLTLTSSHLLFSRCHLFWDHLRSWAPGLPRETRLLPWFANRRYWHCLRSLV